MSGGLKDNVVDIVDPLDITGAKQRRERKAARKIERKRERLAQQRQAIEAIRMAQIQRAQVAAAGEVTGVGEASGLLGGLGSIQSQAGANLGFMQTQTNLRNQAEARLEKAAYYEFTSDLAKSFMSTAGKAG